MLDINNVEIKTGDVVVISEAFCDCQNGRYLVTYSPGDPGYDGSDYKLAKCSASGEIKIERLNGETWPLKTRVTDTRRVYESDTWNAAHAQIEIQAIEDKAPIAAYFQNAALRLEKFLLNSGHESLLRSDWQTRTYYRAIARALA